MSTGEWWEKAKPVDTSAKKKGKAPKRIIDLNVPRDQVVAFALYTVDGGTLKLTDSYTRSFPMNPERSDWKPSRGKQWKEIPPKVKITYPGWTAHFRVTDWDATKDTPYRVRHGENATYEGTIRKDPIDQDTIVIGNLFCNSSRTKGPRPMIIENLKAIDPDMLFFAGDQTYHHTEHTAGWIEFGFITIPRSDERPPHGYHSRRP